MEVIKGYVDRLDLCFFEEKEEGMIDAFYKEAVLIKKAICNTVKGVGVIYKKRIEIKDSIISELTFFEATFYGGLTISNSVIGSFRLMDSRYRQEPIIIRNCIFTGDIDFKGGVFEKDIVIEGCIFLKGHNFIQDIEYPKGVRRPEYFKVKL
ncbi:hypothetical protein [Saprospira grandis]|uniref:Uncharacterized protein n=1 Tax=Saprospira grandis (strain Lewin) TaxID=984262 RepID=H6L8G7_SAPGL|nr:hypothetical protein [Saprospira grandis]AFC26692.1 hypothetical protein SGRA_3977 [Saprospira grandis str. Lewin]